MGHLIDTSVLIAIERSGADLSGLQARLRTGDVAISSVTAGELLHGAHRANTARRRTARLAFIEGMFELMPVLPYDLEVAQVHARIWSDLAAVGTPIGAHDMMIGATALHHGLTIATRNARDFGRIEGLRVEVW